VSFRSTASLSATLPRTTAGVALIRFKNHPTAPGEETFSALWRGYIADFRLSPEGALTLIAFHYPLALGKPTVQVSERLEGNFWLVMKSHFEGDRVYIPFEAGMLVTDEQQWVIENREALEILKHPLQHNASLLKISSWTHPSLSDSSSR
jgi:hypothetical protein